ncbi:M90 family metallopeptidase [Leptospira venezuelensis]|uniref:M90 family metallopeptidase n=1 Tax=Leptospira venezuelensis TaxID=1958811 RepID=UPI000A35D987|nr:M90 family metallopeptidase [Leptospira venezuelensis]
MKSNYFLGFIRRVLLRPYVYFINLPKIWVTFLDKEIDYYNRLNNVERKRINALIQHFVISKKFIGANGFQISKSHEYTISCLAVRLIKNIGLHHFDSIHTIVVFPSAFKTEEFSSFVDGVTGDQGMVGLSWRAVERGFKNPEDGDCVVTHEFTHVIDLSSGNFNGIPRLESESFYQSWIKLLINNFPEIKREVFDSLGYIGDETELFAYLSELYFEKPDDLLTKKPQVFGVLNNFYKEYPEKLLTNA